MLVGNYHHSLQSKRRLAIPASFRKELGENAMITRGIEQCLNILPFNIWSDLTKNLGSNPLAGADSRNFRRLLGHEAYELEYDSQGRVVIPQSLIEWASLSKTVVVAGSINWIEVWDVELYKNALEDLKADTSKIAERISNANLS
ncbi:MAG: division/cell wall cluster transcriptional repressor MraZ [Candidatus Pacebacteria bacterium CG10_big_fil_rev_8_21_14_0_10_42_12]|nr:MAG: division/cell wall cluster transcriptional repressor MraZ [Candidatus Pacebacteria bacterium CG10_big_fil_rev_8_21_14_0_10_42_12]